MSTCACSHMAPRKLIHGRDSYGYSFSFYKCGVCGSTYIDKNVFDDVWESEVKGYIERSVRRKQSKNGSRPMKWD